MDIDFFLKKERMDKRFHLTQRSPKKKKCHQKFKLSIHATHFYWKECSGLSPAFNLGSFFAAATLIAFHLWVKMTPVHHHQVALGPLFSKATLNYPLGQFSCAFMFWITEKRRKERIIKNSVRSGKLGSCFWIANNYKRVRATDGLKIYLSNETFFFI